MRLYTDGTGCFVLLFIFIFIMIVLGTLSRLLFATPLGIILLIVLGVWYYSKDRKKGTPRGQNNYESSTERENRSTYEGQESPSRKKVDEDLSRDAIDVEYKEIDDENL